MYADPKLVRDAEIIRLRLNDYETQLVDELVELTGEQRSVILRRLLMAQVEIALAEAKNTEP